MDDENGGWTKAMKMVKTKAMKTRRTKRTWKTVRVEEAKSGDNPMTMGMRIRPARRMRRGQREKES